MRENYSLPLRILWISILIANNIMVYTNEFKEYENIMKLMKIPMTIKESKEENIKIEDMGRKFILKDKNNFTKVLELLAKYPPPKGELDELRNTTAVLFANDDMLAKLEVEDIPEGMNIYISSDSELAKTYDIPFPGIYGYNSEYNVSYKFDILGNLRSKLGMIIAPILDEIKESNIQYYQHSTLPVLYIFNNNINMAKKRFLSSAIEFRTNVRLALVQFDAQRNPLKNFGISEKTDLPCIVNIANRKKFKEINLTSEKLSRFLKEYVDGTLEPYYASGKVPKDNDKRNTKIIVRENYKKLVEESEKDALLIFHSPHCMWCVKLKPAIEELGKISKGRVLIGTIDMSVNDMPDWDIRAYPTIYLVQARSKKRIQYDRGERSINEFIKFIKEKGEDKINLEDETNKVSL